VLDYVGRFNLESSFFVESVITIARKIWGAVNAITAPCVAEGNIVSV
jgi:hypothetical protein